MALFKANLVLDQSCKYELPTFKMGTGRLIESNTVRGGGGGGHKVYGKNVRRALKFQ